MLYEQNYLFWWNEITTVCVNIYNENQKKIHHEMLQFFEGFQKIYYYWD